MHDNEAEIIGKWGEDLVMQLLEDTFRGAEISRENPDRGTDFFCKIIPPRPSLPLVEWRIQVKTTTKPHRIAWKLPSERIDALQCKIKGSRIKACWFTQGVDSSYWLLFNVVFAGDYLKLARMPKQLRFSHAAVYVVDMVQAINRLLEENEHLIFETAFDDRFHDLGTPVANEVTSSLLTFLWASHAWVTIRKPIKRVFEAVRVTRGEEDCELRWAQEMWRSLSSFERLITRLPLAVQAVNLNTARRIRTHLTRAGDVVLTLQDDFVEDVLTCLMDLKNHLVFKAFSERSESGETWIMQVGRRVVEGAVFESILAHQLARLIINRGYKLIVRTESEAKIFPEISVPGFGAIVHGFYSPGLEFENTKQCDREASERRSFYLHAGGGLRLYKPADVLNSEVLECFGLERFPLRDLCIEQCPTHLLPDRECVHTARDLISHLVIPGAAQFNS